MEFSLTRKIWTYLCILGIMMNAKLTTAQEQDWPKIGLICTKYSCRDFESTITFAIDDKITWDSTVITNYYKLSTESLEVFPLSSSTLAPGLIIDAMCKKFITNGVNTIIYANTNIHDTYEKTAMLGYRYLTMLSNTLGIPLIAWNPAVTKNHVKNEDSNFLQLMPSIVDQCNTMIDLLKHYDWHLFSIITTATDGHNEFVSHLRTMSDKTGEYSMEVQSVIKILQVDQVTVRAQLEKLSEESRIILLHSTLEEAKIIFDVAQNLSLTTEKYQWIVSKNVLGGTEGEINEDSNFPSGTIAITYNTDEASVMEAIGKATQIWLKALENFVSFPGNVDRISIMPDVNCTDPHKIYWKDSKILYQFMKNVSIPDGKFAIEFNEEGILKNTKMSIVNFNKDDGAWKEIGNWNSVDKVTLNEITWPGNKAKPPKDRPEKWKLEIVTLDEEPYVMLNEMDKVTGKCPSKSVKARWAPKNLTDQYPNATYNSTLYKCLTGFAIDLLIRLESDIGFEYNLYKVEDEKWGDNETGEWNGLVRTLMDHKADMCITSLKINNDRNDVIDFSNPFLETGITIIVGIRRGVISPTAFLEPYDYPSWCLILVFSVHAAGTGIFIFEWLSPRGLDKGATPTRDHKFSLFRSFWLIWAMLFGAAVDTDTPRGIASRFMASVWALFALVFLASYTANLAAFMIAKEDFFKLQGIQDPKITNPTSVKPPFRYGTTKSGNTANVLRNNYPEQYSYMETFNTDNKDQGIQKVRDGLIDAFIYDSTVLEYLTGKDKDCKLRTVGNWYARTGYGLSFPKGDKKWLPRFNHYIMKYQEEGWLENQQRFWMAGACKKSGSGRQRSESSHPLGIINFTSAYYLLAGGVLLAIMLMLLEHCFFKFVRRKLGKWDKCGCCGLISLSMGKSLTFEQSVMEMLDVSKNYKCKNALCETQMWKVRHELDVALLRIERLQNRLRDLGFKSIPSNPSLKRSKSKPSIGWKAGDEQPAINHSSSNNQEPAGMARKRSVKTNPQQDKLEDKNNTNWVPQQKNNNQPIDTQPIVLRPVELGSMKPVSRSPKINEHQVTFNQKADDSKSTDNTNSGINKKSVEKDKKGKKSPKASKRQKNFDGKVYCSVPASTSNQDFHEKLESMESVV